LQKLPDLHEQIVLIELRADWQSGFVGMRNYAVLNGSLLTVKLEDFHPKYTSLDFVLNHKNELLPERGLHECLVSGMFIEEKCASCKEPRQVPVLRIVAKIEVSESRDEQGHAMLHVIAHPQ
jgi:hypothetical protein